MVHIRNEIVVGLNGTAASDSALQFAAAEAQRRQADLVLVHAWHVAPSVADLTSTMVAGVRDAEAALLEKAAGRLAELAPDVTSTTRLVESSTATALVQASESARMVVVGRARGRKAWLGPVLGHLAIEADCPVVAVPEGTTPLPAGDVVVGVDGSVVSGAAIAFAFEEASARGSGVVAVSALDPDFDAFIPSESLLDQILEQGRRQISESLAGWRENYPDVTVRELVSLGSPDVAIQQAGHGAALIVVGSHGRGAVKRVVLGSVSSSLLRDAPCPVAVLRTP
ncbi:MAG: UspA domain protein [Frankiales bacterium]|nr:UspA domain protein [Frankiales bacterium]